MKVNTMREFHNFLNELGLERGHTRDFLYDIFTYNYYNRDLYILELEKRQVICTSQTFSSDGNGLLKRTILYELYIETYSNIKDTTVLTFKTLEDLQKVEQFIKDNFKFLKKGEKYDN